MGLSSSSWGYPNSWSIGETPILKWMTGSTPISQNHHMEDLWSTHRFRSVSLQPGIPWSSHSTTRMSLSRIRPSPTMAFMWFKLVQTMPCLPSPSHHHFYRWYIKHSMAGLWHCLVCLPFPVMAGLWHCLNPITPTWLEFAHLFLAPTLRRRSLTTSWTAGCPWRVLKIAEEKSHWRKWKAVPFAHSKIKYP